LRRKVTLAILGGVGLCVVFVVGTSLAQQAQPPATPRMAKAPLTANKPPVSSMPLDSQKALLTKYCEGCHNDKLKTGGMTLTALDLAHVEQNPQLTEKVIWKMRTGLMPPAGRPRPDAATEHAFAIALETEMDRAAALHPNPGSRPFQRLTRTEYANSIQNLLGITEDIEALLPADALSNEGMDNNAETEGFSATLGEAYMRAAAKISRDALGDPKAEATSSVWKIDSTMSQLRHIEGTPFGTRGGISVTYNLPADGEYNFRVMLHADDNGLLWGNVNGEQVEVSVDGERVWLGTVDPGLTESLATGMNVYTGKIPLKAGMHRLAAAFLVRHSEINNDVIAPIEFTLASQSIGTNKEIVEYPHLREFEISGPFNPTGVSDTASRRKVFTCRPLSASEEEPCAKKIITTLASEAYRRPVTSEDMEGLMSFYDRARKRDNFETGIRLALQAILASPDFVFRLEKAPATVKPGQIYRIGDIELASRLSYFLWNMPPDDELMSLAGAGRLHEPLTLNKQVHRMLLDAKSESLSTKFAAQWLELARLDSLQPDPAYYPNYDHTLAMGLRREVELFFDSIVRQDHNVLDLLTANYTFVNERVAKNYGIPNIAGEQLRRVELPSELDYRRGLLGKGAVMAMTAQADRTSPVQRGKWVMSVLLGTPPPPPPPNVPKLEETNAVATGKVLTVRERMETHRRVDPCASCHRMIDPVGLALENFDVTGEWRVLDRTATMSGLGIRIHTGGLPIDTKTALYDGTPMDSPATLRHALLNHSDVIIENLTMKLMSYSIGRKLEYYDMPLIRSIDREAAKNNNKFSAIVLGIVNSDAFQKSKAEATSTDAANKN
jgi:hypothetical protein